MKEKQARHPRAGGTSERALGMGTWSADLQRRGSQLALTSCLPWGCEWPGGGGGHRTASTHPPCFFPVSRLLVQLMWLLLYCISLGQKKNAKPLRVKMKVSGSVFLCLLASTANRELASFLLKLHILSPQPPAFFTFKAGSLIRTAFKLAAPGMRGVMNGAFLVFLASFPFVLSLPRVLLATLWSRNYANHLLLGSVGHCLNFAARPGKKSSFYYCL